MSSRLLRITGFATCFIMVFMMTAFRSFIIAEAADCVAAKKGVIVIDPGHGGVDGGASRGDVLEKDINLKLAVKIKTLLENRKVNVILTRERDVSLDYLNKASSSRHLRDLIARAELINMSEARIFLSIHVNCNANNPADNGSIVFYGNKFQQSKSLATFLQNELNNVRIEGMSRESNGPSPGRYYLLDHTHIPGVIVETAFISNKKEREMLITEEFLDELAAAIAAGTEHYLTAEEH